MRAQKLPFSVVAPCVVSAEVDLGSCKWCGHSGFTTKEGDFTSLFGGKTGPSYYHLIYDVPFKKVFFLKNNPMFLNLPAVSISHMVQ